MFNRCHVVSTAQTRRRTILPGVFSLCILASAGSVLATLPTPSTPVFAGIHGEFKARIVAEGLNSPDGIAIHPLSGEVYVSEEEGAKIDVIRNGRAVPALEPDWYVVDDLPGWLLAGGEPASFWLQPILRSPEGIAFSEDGKLYVVEDSPNGRLLEFRQDVQGKYREAHVIPVPSLEQPCSWEGVTVAQDGRIFLAGSTLEAGEGLFYGIVLVRYPSGKWAAVDYGPLASFSCAALSRDEDILVVSEEITGHIAWWDAVRHIVIGTVTQDLSNIESVWVLPDGSILAAQESGNGPKGEKGGRLFRINPQTGEARIVADGFGTIETVVASRETGRLYVTEDSSGRLFELTPTTPITSPEYLLQRTVRQFEARRGLPPKKWPTFLKSFFSNLGIETLDEKAVLETRKLGKPSEHREMSLQDMGDRLPFIAGKVKAKPGMDVNDPDPVEQMDFIIFFPNKMVRNGVTTPSLSLVSVTHKSGMRERTRVVEGQMSTRNFQDSRWDGTMSPASIFIPIASCSAIPRDEGMDIALTFLGLGQTGDYFLSVSLGRDNSGSLVVEEKGGYKADYDLQITEIDPNGVEQVNVVVAGARTQDEDVSNWLDIGENQLMWMSLGGIKKKGSWVSHWIEHKYGALLAQLNAEEGYKPVPIDQRVPSELELQQKAAAVPEAAPVEDKVGIKKGEKAPGTNISSVPAETEKQVIKTSAKPMEAMPPRAEAPSKEAPPPRAENPPKDQQAGLDEEKVWTNVILSRAVALWRNQEF